MMQKRLINWQAFSLAFLVWAWSCPAWAMDLNFEISDIPEAGIIEEEQEISLHGEWLAREQCRMRLAEGDRTLKEWYGNIKNAVGAKEDTLAAVLKEINENRRLLHSVPDSFSQKFQEILQSLGYPEEIIQKGNIRNRTNNERLLSTEPLTNLIGTSRIGTLIQFMEDWKKLFQASKKLQLIVNQTIWFQKKWQAFANKVINAFFCGSSIASRDNATLEKISKTMSNLHQKRISLINESRQFENVLPNLSLGIIDIINFYETRARALWDVIIAWRKLPQRSDFIPIDESAFHDNREHNSLKSCHSFNEDNLPPENYSKLGSDYFERNDTVAELKKTFTELKAWKIYEGLKRSAEKLKVTQNSECPFLSPDWPKLYFISNDEVVDVHHTPALKKTGEKTGENQYVLYGRQQDNSVKLFNPTDSCSWQCNFDILRLHQVWNKHKDSGVIFLKGEELEGIHYPTNKSLCDTFCAAFKQPDQKKWSQKIKDIEKELEKLANAYFIIKPLEKLITYYQDFCTVYVRNLAMADNLLAPWAFLGMDGEIARVKQKEARVACCLDDNGPLCFNIPQVQHNDDLLLLNTTGSVSFIQRNQDQMRSFPAKVSDLFARYWLETLFGLPSSPISLVSFQDIQYYEEDIYPPVLLQSRATSRQQAENKSLAYLGNAAFKQLTTHKMVVVQEQASKKTLMKFLHDFKDKDKDNIKNPFQKLDADSILMWTLFSIWTKSSLSPENLELFQKSKKAPYSLKRQMSLYGGPLDLWLSPSFQEKSGKGHILCEHNILYLFPHASKSIPSQVRNAFLEKMQSSLYVLNAWIQKMREGQKYFQTFNGYLEDSMGLELLTYPIKELLNDASTITGLLLKNDVTCLNILRELRPKVYPFYQVCFQEEETFTIGQLLINWETLTKGLKKAKPPSYEELEKLYGSQKKKSHQQNQEDQEIQENQIFFPENDETPFDTVPLKSSRNSLSDMRKALSDDPVVQLRLAKDDLTSQDEEIKKESQQRVLDLLDPMLRAIDKSSSHKSFLRSLYALPENVQDEVFFLYTFPEHIQQDILLNGLKTYSVATSFRKTFLNDVKPLEVERARAYEKICLQLLKCYGLHIQTENHLNKGTMLPWEQRAGWLLRQLWSGTLTLKDSRDDALFLDAIVDLLLLPDDSPLAYNSFGENLNITMQNKGSSGFISKKLREEGELTKNAFGFNFKEPKKEKEPAFNSVGHIQLNLNSGKHILKITNEKWLNLLKSSLALSPQLLKVIANHPLDLLYAEFYQWFHTNKFPDVQFRSGFIKRLHQKSKIIQEFVRNKFRENEICLSSDFQPVTFPVMTFEDIMMAVDPVLYCSCKAALDAAKGNVETALVTLSYRDFSLEKHVNLGWISPNGKTLLSILQEENHQQAEEAYAEPFDPRQAFWEMFVKSDPRTYAGEAIKRILTIASDLEIDFTQIKNPNWKGIIILEKMYPSGRISYAQRMQDYTAIKAALGLKLNWAPLPVKAKSNNSDRLISISSSKTNKAQAKIEIGDAKIESTILEPSETQESKSNSSVSLTLTSPSKTTKIKRPQANLEIGAKNLKISGTDGDIQGLLEVIPFFSDHITHLDLSHNQIRFIDQRLIEVLNGFNSLIYLNLKKNRLHNPEPLRGLPQKGLAIDLRFTFIPPYINEQPYGNFFFTEYKKANDALFLMEVIGKHTTPTLLCYLSQKYLANEVKDLTHPSPDVLIAIMEYLAENKLAETLGFNTIELIVKGDCWASPVPVDDLAGKLKRSVLLYSEALKTLENYHTNKNAFSGESHKVPKDYYYDGSLEQNEQPSMAEPNYLKDLIEKKELRSDNLFNFLDQHHPRRSAYVLAFLLKFGLPSGTILSHKDEGQYVDGLVFHDNIITREGSCLKELRISQNLAINTCNPSPEKILLSLKPFIYLHELYLTSLDLKSLDDLPEIETLQLLDVSCNQITDLDGLNTTKNNKTVVKFPRLDTLDISENQVATLEGLLIMPSLTVLNAHKNNIVDFISLYQSREDSSSFKFKNIKFLDLSFNKIEIGSSDWQQAECWITSLAHFDIHNNGLEFMPKMTHYPTDFFDISNNFIPSTKLLDPDKVATKKYKSYPQRNLL